MVRDVGQRHEDHPPCFRPGVEEQGPGRERGAGQVDDRQELVVPAPQEGEIDESGDPVERRDERGGHQEGEGGSGGQAGHGCGLISPRISGRRVARQIGVGGRDIVPMACG